MGLGIRYRVSVSGLARLFVAEILEYGLGWGIVWGDAQSEFGFGPGFVIVPRCAERVGEVGVVLGILRRDGDGQLVLGDR